MGAKQTGVSKEMTTFLLKPILLRINRSKRALCNNEK